jgi:hypothetical protein
MTRTEDIWMTLDNGVVRVCQEWGLSRATVYSSLSLRGMQK